MCFMWQDPRLEINLDADEPKQLKLPSFGEFREFPEKVSEIDFLTFQAFRETL